MKKKNSYIENIYRVNLGVRRDTFIKMFGHLPKRPWDNRRSDKCETVI
ncbi:hypothetical protein ABXS75_06745 [Roseburia hominis]